MDEARKEEVVARRITSQSVQIARRAGLGRNLELTDADRAEVARRENERKERLARIASRAKNND